MEDCIWETTPEVSWQRHSREIVITKHVHILHELQLSSLRRSRQALSFGSSEMIQPLDCIAKNAVHSQHLRSPSALETLQL